MLLIIVFRMQLKYQQKRMDAKQRHKYQQKWIEIRNLNHVRRDSKCLNMNKEFCVWLLQLTGER